MARVYSNTPEPRYVQYAQALIPDGTADGNPDVLIPAPLTIGTGHDSVILKSTPNSADPSVDRTNAASGDFSAVLAGSRNVVTGAEASSVGGRNTVSGNDAFAAGYHGTSSGENSFTAGYNNTASGGSSFAIGFQTEASGEASFAGGRKTEAGGDYSSAFGRATAAMGENAFSEGKFTLASGEGSHAEGLGVASNDRSEASGKASHAEGWYTKAVGVASHTEGTDTIANGDYSHAEGDTTHTNGLGQHSEGVGTIATSASGNNGQHVAGRYNIETEGARVTGGGTKNSARANLEVLDWLGNLTIAGKMTVGAAPTNDMDVTTKKYVDDAVAGGGGGGTEVIPNPELSGDEPALTGLQVGDNKFAVPQGTEVVANPASTGEESELARLQVGERVYKIPGSEHRAVGLLKDKFTHASFSMEHPVLKLTVYKDSLTSYTVEDGNYVLLIYPGPKATSSLFYPAEEGIPEDAHAIQISVVDGEIILEGAESASVFTCPFDLNPSDSCFMLYSSDSMPGYYITNATDVTGIGIGAEYVQEE